MVKLWWAYNGPVKDLKSGGVDIELRLHHKSQVVKSKIYEFV